MYPFFVCYLKCYCVNSDRSIVIFACKQFKYDLSVFKTSHQSRMHFVYVLWWNLERQVGVSGDPVENSKIRSAFFKITKPCKSQSTMRKSSSPLMLCCSGPPIIMTSILHASHLVKKITMLKSKLYSVFIDYHLDPYFMHGSCEYG